MKLKKKNFNYYGYKHKKVREIYGDLDGNLDYVGTFSLENGAGPFAVYHAPNPDASKGHKEFVLLDGQYVRGKTAEEMEIHRKQIGRYCSFCRDVIYSVRRHDCRWCSCGLIMIDGGTDYLRCSLEGVPVEIDFITNKVTEIKDEHST